MHRSGGRNTQPERRSKKLKHYLSRHKDLEPELNNWGKKQGDRQHQSGKGVPETERQEQKIPIPDKVPQ